MHDSAKIVNALVCGRPVTTSTGQSIYEEKNQILEIAVRWVGAESTSPCIWVKRLADLLRKEVNSQQYPSIYEDRRPKKYRGH